MNLTLPAAIVLLAIIGIQSYLVFLVLQWLNRMTEAQEAISRTLAIIARNTAPKPEHKTSFQGPPPGDNWSDSAVG